MDFFDINSILLEELHDLRLEEKQIRLYVARLDKIHPVVSGNKLFKLYYYLERALAVPAQPVKTYGGAYSNHLVATAFACNRLGLSSIGVVRGERPDVFSHTLLQCEELGMHLEFASRDEYADLSKGNHFNAEECINIPEGGFEPDGARGASVIMDHLKSIHPTHICTATGTATTLAGMLQKATSHQIIISVPVLKNMHDLPERLQFLNGQKRYKNLDVWNDFHFGGYAKKNEELFRFMNQFYEMHAVPTDFVYTGKMMYGVMKKINENYFAPGSVVCCLHTGGLQGNLSLPDGSLVF